MTQGFILCPHCAAQHPTSDVVCGATGRALRAEPGATAAGHKPVRAPRRSAKAEEKSLEGALVDGKYQVLGLVGEGGMGKVYEAEHVALGRRVALKVLHPGFVSRDDALARFHREARAAGSIGHPNICEVYDVGYLPDLSPYMVMELLTGTTLGDRLVEEGCLPFNDVFDIITQVLSALVAAHGKGIIHRDIKPDNVFLSERVGCPPMVKLLDFGIVKAKHDQLELTHAGTVMGTPFYMAPELIRGRPFDHRIDLYACGVVLFEMLTGVLPFDAPHYHELANLILREDPPDATELRQDLSTSWLPVLDKALSKDPDARYRDAKEFLSGLEDLKSGLAIRRSMMSLPVAARDSDPHATLDEQPADSIDIPVIQSLGGLDLRVPESAPDTIFDPHAAEIVGQGSDNAAPVSSRDPSTPMIRKWQQESRSVETRRAGTGMPMLPAQMPLPSPAPHVDKPAPPLCVPDPQSAAEPDAGAQQQAPVRRLDSCPPPTVRSSEHADDPDPRKSH